MNKKETTGDPKTLSRSALRRQREREYRYQTILKAAEQLFARDGYHKTSMEKIADAAEVSVGTVYFYFKNKEDLLIRLIDEIGYQLRNLLGNEFKAADGTMEGFKRAGHIFFQKFCPKHPEKVSIFFRESAGQSPYVEERRKKIFDKLIGDVKEALSRLCQKQGGGYQSDISAEVMAVSIMGMYERIAYHYLIWQGRTEDLKAIGKDAVDFIVGGINNLSRMASLE
jgi:AcrR family transcriptional regulator